MSRKLFALFVLIGALGFLMLVYLYFFVYYTATVVVQANVDEYRVEMFSKSTAQKREQICPEEDCTITDVSPFEYNIFIKKQGYKEVVLNAKISPRKRQNFVVELEKETRLNPIELEKQTETAQQKIQRLRDVSKYHTSFRLSSESQVNFMQKQNQLEMFYKTGEEEKSITVFPLVKQEDIQVEYISEAQQDLYIQVGNIYYIFTLESGRLYTLPYELELRYIKPAKTFGNYLVVTDKGTFLYSISNGDSEFQYLFKDFIYHEDTLIGVIYKDEDQKKKNFNLDEKGHLIIQYNPNSKERKVLMKTDLNIERIEWKGDKVVFSANEKEYELDNF